MDIISLLGAVVAIVSVIVVILKLRTVDVAGVAQEFLDDYRAELDRLQKRIDKLEKEAEKSKREILRLSYELSGARERISVLEGENEQLTSENAMFKERIQKIVGRMNL